MARAINSRLFLAFALLFLWASTGEIKAAAPAQRSVTSASQLRSQDFLATPVINLLGFYTTSSKGGGLFYYRPSGCVASVTGDLTASSATIKNYIGTLYAGEGITSAGRFPAGTKIASVSWTHVNSFGNYATGSPTVSAVPYTANIVAGMSVSGPGMTTGRTVVSTTAPSTVINTTGTLNNGQDIDVASAVGITVGMYVTVTAITDSLPKTTVNAPILPGVTVASIVGTTVHLTGSLGIVGVTGVNGASLSFTSTDGSVTLSGNAGSNKTGVALEYYTQTATATQVSNSTNSAAAITANGDDGGLHIVDSAGHCYVRQGPPPDVTGWGAVPDGVTDSTVFIQNNIIAASTDNTAHGLSGAVVFPAGIGVYKVSSLFLLRPVTFNGLGRQQAILQQIDGQAAQTPMVYIFSTYPIADQYESYAHPEFAFKNMSFRGPDDVANTIGLYVDGYDAAVPLVPNGSHLFMNDFTVDNFKSFGIYTGRVNNVIGRGFNVQIKGVGTDNGANDCLHSDFSVTWGFYYLVTSACDSGLYLNSPTSWSIFRAVAFSNNHGATITGTASSALNNAQIVLDDFEFGNNKQNGFVVDVQDVRVFCKSCRVQDSGQVSTAGTYSDYEVTANAGIANGPILTVTGGFFSDIHANVGAQNHLYNIVFDNNSGNVSGKPAFVAFDNTNTTSAAGNRLYSNIDADMYSCTTCTSYRTGGYPLGASILSAQDNLTAHAGGGQANATQITTDIARFGTVATDLDSGQLPPANGGGRCVEVRNGSASHSLQIYANVLTTDTINAIAGSTGVTQSPFTSMRFCSPANAKWTVQQVYLTGNGVLCPTSELCTYTAQQTICKNTTCPGANSSATLLQLIGNDTSATTIELDTYGGNPTFLCRRADGTAASKTAVQSGELLCVWAARPYDGSAFATNNVARTEVIAEENFDASHHGASWEVECTALAATNSNPCFKIAAAGITALGTAPSVTGTGSPTVTSGSTDTSGEVTGGASATSIVITFLVAKTNAPFCVVTPQTSVASFVYSISTTAITITQTATSGQKVDYTCFQH